jgi:hypothetical protein
MTSRIELGDVLDRFRAAQGGTVGALPALLKS